eukprot:12193468-Alexandrium_andersonii.AAC.1
MRATRSSPSCGAGGRRGCTWKTPSSSRGICTTHRARWPEPWSGDPRGIAAKAHSSLRHFRRA